MNFKIKHIILSIGLFLLFENCNHKKNGMIKIHGSIKDTSIKKVYLTNAINWEVLLDSAEVRNGGFEINYFKQKSDNSLYSIGYFDKWLARKNFEFINRILSPEKIKYLINAFIIDSIEVKISFANNSNYYDLESGKENEAFFATQMMNFGVLDDQISKRDEQFNTYNSVIKKHPQSQYLLSAIFNNKAQIKKNEFEILLKNFNPSVFNSELGKTVYAYSLKKEDTPVLENLKLNNQQGEIKSIYSSTAKINMVVIWASWCGPCRMEIPALKTIFEKYKNKGLSLTSISLDENKEAWTKALDQEKMPWDQLIVAENEKNTFNTQYEVGSIPYVIFLDKNGSVIKRFVGLEEKQSEMFEVIIRSYIK